VCVRLRQELEGRCCIRHGTQRGQAILELAIQIPLMLAILFGAVEVGRLFYVYHALEKSLRGGAAFLARSTGVDYCNSSDLTLADARNFIVYGNLQGTGTPVVQGLTPDLIQIYPERTVAGSTGVVACVCTEDSESCLVPGGRPPDFVVVNLGNGFPLTFPFPFVNLGTINLKASVRMPVTGD
jgi:hypothetical protein